MRIGELATRTGVSVRALRYYEEQGLLRARRTDSDQRVYDTDAIDRVRLLRRLYTAGLTSANIASLLPCVDSPSASMTAESLAVMVRERARISAQIAELVVTRDHLTYLIDEAGQCRPAQLGAEAHGMTVDA